MFPSRVLVVDDYEPFRRLVCSLLQENADFQVIGQASDGLETIQKAEELQPDLILLDIHLPKLNGIASARRVHEVVPQAKILFISQESSSDVVAETLGLGATGYIHKPRTGRDLLAAMEAVLAGKRFVSSDLQGWESGGNTPVRALDRHEVQFYSDDQVFLESFACFIAAALAAGNAALALVTKAHQDGLLQRLKAQSVDVDGAIQRGAYISLDAEETLSAIMVDGMPNPVRFFEGLGSLIKAACQAAKAEHPRVAFCGERVGLLWAEGKIDAAIRLEQLCNDLTKKYDVDILCAYPLSGKEDRHSFNRVREEHSAIHSR